MSALRERCPRTLPCRPYRVGMRRRSRSAPWAASARIRMDGRACSQRSVSISCWSMARAACLPSHGIRHIRGAGDQIAAGKEVRPAGFERETIHLDGAVRFDLQARSFGEIQIDRFAHGQDHRVAFKRCTSSVRTGLRRPERSYSPSRVFTTSSAFTLPLGVADDAVRRRQKDNLRPSSSAAAVSSSMAGMSLRSRR